MLLFHTLCIREYSYGKRRLNSDIIQKYPALVSAQKDGVPQLWKNAQWSENFAQFIIELTKGQENPSVIEIHPPFSDYADIGGFIDRYIIFEQIITDAFPEVDILLENRCGSVYRGGKFIVSKQNHIEMLCEYIENYGLKLKIAYDIPQVYTAHNVKKPNEYLQLLEEAQQIRMHIGGVHLWGKRRSQSGRKIAHCGDLNSYFEYNEKIKNAFLLQFAKCFDDNIVRKMVLEVNSENNDMISIIEDLRGIGIRFV
jgi:hypothetical protein